MCKSLTTRVLMFIVLLIMVLFFVFLFLSSPVSVYDVVIYGGEFPGCASAYSASWTAPEKKVLLIVPETVAQVGGLGTVGGQNFADIRYWRNQVVTAGSFQRWFEESGQFYNSEQMAEIIKQDLEQFPNLTVLYQHDIKKVKVKKINKGENLIKSLVVAPIFRDEKGTVLWGKGQARIKGQVFVDASAEGRLARLGGSPLLVGRQDWPEEYLPLEERRGVGARQQAATLMFKITGVQTPLQSDMKGDLHFVTDLYGSWAIVGGKETWQNNLVVKSFNEVYGPQGWAIKPLNAAQNGVGSEEWWVNALLVFDVDGQVREKDRGTAFFSRRGRSGVEQKSVDQVWQETKVILQKPEFLKALQQFKVVEDGQMYGLGEAQLVNDEDGEPVVAQTMYLRETVHVSSALSTREVQKAGSSPLDGEDQDNYKERIGLGYYLMDINAYMYEDLLQDKQYVWPVTKYLRPDWQKLGGQPLHPVYLPYSMLKCSNCVNLLLPGYATGSSSLAWSQIRVLPVLTVLGDAAGVSAARAVLFEENPSDFEVEQIAWVQEKLSVMGARLEK